MSEIVFRDPVKDADLEAMVEHLRGNGVKLEDIAKRIGMSKNQTRNILYRMQRNGRCRPTPRCTQVEPFLKLGVTFDGDD